ncbi:hypothetical protein FLL45_10390 [Aliikangiella marina]|uniref:Flagellar assembly protein FliH n=1 Tax=Aliikangiella marina TaxID=1712262 RepID=A0A545TDN9_9GAMM|nr:FliH/SctL family protein [Aliikangiella marina]TQV75333.1 hypothetical protein FLL45_10390 [Aliikangiella marina]
MVTKTRSDQPIKLIRNASNVNSWKVPELGFSSAPSFHHPAEEEEQASNEEVVAEVSEEELAEIRETARQEGLKIGRDEGLKIAQEEVTNQLTMLNLVMGKLAEPLKECKDQTQQQLLELAFAIARQIVRRELRQDPTQIIAVIREALKLLPAGAEGIVISLHPEDANKVTSALSIDPSNQTDNWQIKSDPAVERGSCQVDTHNSKIDASIDKQIAVLFSRIVGGERAGESTDE